MRLLLSGDGFFLDRHAPLVRSLTSAGLTVDRLAAGNLATWAPQRVFNRLTRGTPLHGRLLRPDPNPTAFRIRSKRTQAAIERLQPAPDLVLHIFCSFAPAWTASRPYAMYLDFTMAQADREYPIWAAFGSRRRRALWLSYERRTYAAAQRLFTMAESGARSLVDDYGVDATRVTVVGSGGHFDEPCATPKTFGSGRIMFDASDFHRKGTDIVLAAIEQVRQRIPHATLVVVGRTLDRSVPGVDNVGIVKDPAEMRKLFLSSDLVVSAARCDPFPGFVIEGLHYGTPAVTSRASGVSRHVHDAGAGVVVDGDSPERFAEAFVALLDDRARLETMSAAARRLVWTTLNWDTVAQQMARVLVDWQTGRRA